MFIQLFPNVKEPLYSQLVQEIIKEMARKELQPGDKLPSVRVLAQDLGINLHTVNKAYKQLEDMGFILIQRKKGAIIQPNGLPKLDSSYQDKLSTSLQAIIAESICYGMDEATFIKECQKIFNLFQQKGESSR